MAKQAGDLLLSGTIAGICFYRLEGQYYARQKSSLDGRRVKTSVTFAETMHYAGLLARASRLAAAVYKGFPAEKKNRSLYRKLTGKAFRLLKSGCAEDEILLQLELPGCIDATRNKLH